MNKTGGSLTGQSLDKVNIHPGWTKLVVVGWRSPISGNVSITGSLADTDNSCGDGVLWYIDKNDSNLASGSFGEGGSQNLVNIGSSISDIPVKQGDFIYFVVHPNASSYCDTTMLDVTITQTDPCADTNGSTQHGIDLVKANPVNYQLFTQTQIDAARQSGIDSVKATPADYQLVTQAQSDQAVKAEQLKWDANGDGRIGLEDIIRMLQVLAGLRP